jgi:choline kinase
VIGIVLAAGFGRRLLPDTLSLPKTLLPVADDRTILDVVLHNLRLVDLDEVVLVVGHQADALRQRVPDLQERHDLRLRLVDNDRVEWNNAYSLWLAREYFAQGALLVNGDTVHPVAVEHALLRPGAGTGVRIAVDSVKTLTDEAMKVLLDDEDRVLRITKKMPVGDAHGEYIGAALIEPDAATELALCLEKTWQGDPGLYYEDGLQLLADRTGAVGGTHIGRLDWVEVDDHADLSRAREIACRY